LLIPGIVILTFSAATYTFCGNIGDFHGGVLANGLAANKDSSASTWFFMNILESMSAAGIAFGIGLLAFGLSSNFFRSR
jgi:hypothetical protein